MVSINQFRRFIVVATLALGLSGLLTACGAGDEGEIGVETSQGSSSSAPQGIQPDVHTNVPPPQGNLTDDSAQDFFDKKEAYDGFSEPLKNTISQSYQIAPGAPLSGNGQGYYNTLMGRSAPVIVTQQQVLSMPGVGCDPTSTFLCLDSPENEFETINAGIDVLGNIDLNQLAVFGANDPVAVVSVFNNSGGGAASEILIMPQDVQETADPNIGRFSAAAALPGAGRFTIVISAYKVINEGVGNELVSIMVTGTRLESPEIEFAEAKPEFNKLAETGHEKDPVQNNAIIASPILHLKVKLLTAGGEGIQTRFENYDGAGNFHSVVTALPVPEGADTFITGHVPLHQGLNKIKAISRAPGIEQLLGADAPPPSIVEFAVFNSDGGPKIKLLKPESRGVLVPQNLATGQKVLLEFCYTFVPTKLAGHPGGSGAPPSPVIGDVCQGGSLGFTPEIIVNGKKITGADNFSYDASSGVFTAQVVPDFGVNLYEIRATEEFSTVEEGKSTSYLTGSFIFGSPIALIRDGQIATEDTFAKRGLNLDIDKAMIQGDIKTLLLKFLNRPETSDMILNIFKKKANGPGYVCNETGGIIVSNGDTTITFDPDTFTLGDIELTEVETSSDGMMHVGARINGMHGEAELSAAEPSGNTFNGKNLGFIPIDFAISRLDVNLGVAFKKNTAGVSELDLRKIEGAELMTITGDGPLGRPVYVNSSRNPLAAGLELLDWQQGLLLNQFNNIIQGTLLCGVEEGMNNAATGSLGRHVDDLENLLSTNANPFRIPINFEIFGQTHQFAVAYNLLRGTIKFDSQGIHITDVPLRVSPGSVKLVQLAQDFSAGLIGSVARWMGTNERSTEQGLTSAENTVALMIGEDGINQAAAALVQQGLLDLTIDANFYNDIEAIPAEKLAPNGASLAPNVDLNFDGNYDSTDQSNPVSMELKMDKAIPPMLTFLTEGEIAQMAAEEEEGVGIGATPEPSASPGAEHEPFFVPGGKYFRLALANVELSVFLNERISDSLGGSQTYCKRAWSDPDSVAAKGFCKLKGDVLIPGSNPLEVPACNGGELVTLPRLNGRKVSYGPAPSPDNVDEVLPLYRARGGLILHGKIAGIDRGFSAKEKVTNPNPPVKTLLHIQFAPKLSHPRAFILALEMVENNTGESNDSLLGNLDTILGGAFSSECENLNELRFPIAERFPAVPASGEEVEPLLPDLGIEAIDLGGTDTLPQVFIDDNHLFMDVLLHAGLVFTDDAP
jgi:hypothetical protein